MSVLDIRGLRVQSANASLVRDANLQLDEGQSLTLLGETGSGKSLLMQAVIGTLPAGLTATGAITLFGEETAAANSRSREKFWGTRLAVLPQEPWLVLDPTMASLRQVCETYSLVAGEPASGELARLKFAELGLAGSEAKLPHALSGGMAQRVALAAAQAGGGRLILVDEPTKGLDATLRESVGRLLLEITESGGSVFTITHDIALARSLGGNVAVMLNGEIVERGPAALVLDHPSHAYTKRLLAAEPSRWPPRLQPAVGDPIVTGQGLTKVFGAQRVFAGLDMAIGEREWLCATGPSGSGKSTLGNVLLGILQPDAGRVIRHAAEPPWKFQKLHQDPVSAFAPRIRLGTSLRDVTELHGEPWSRVENLLDRLRLPLGLLDRRPEQVSGGELQRLALLRALLVDPMLLVADEPTSRLDTVSQQETMQVMLQALADSSCALLMITHDPDLALHISSRNLRMPRDI